jgi:Tfp pilus assembly protein PilV
MTLAATFRPRPVGGPGPARGLAYVEVLVALVLVAVALVPALQALQVGVLGSAVAADASSRDSALREKMEQVLALPFATLYAETYVAGGNTTSSVSDALSDPAGADRRIVIVYRTDGSAVSSSDTGLLRVRVAWQAGGTALETLKAKWW